MGTVPSYPLPESPLPARAFAPLVVLLLALPALAADWQDYAPYPQPITNNAVTTHTRAGTTFVYSFMGIDSTKIWSGISKDARRLNTTTNTWETLPEIPALHGRIAASAVTLGDSVYVIGGYWVADTGAETTNKRLHVWDTVSDAWMTNAADIPLKVDDMVAGTWNDTHIFLVSGWSINHNVTDVQVWEKATNTWSACTPIPDYGTFGGGGAVCGNTIVFMDGTTDTSFASFDPTNRVLVGTINPLDPTDIVWEDRGPHPGPGLYRPASWNIPGDPTRVVFAGGSDNPYNFNGQGYDGNPSEPLDTVFSYHVPTDTYVFHSNKPTPTMDHRGFPWGGGQMWIVGGMEAGQTVTSRVSSWMPDPITAAPVVGSATLPALLVYPNPARSRVLLTSVRPAALTEVRVVDAAGRVVRRLDGTRREHVWDLHNSDGRRVAPGVYWLRTRIDGRNATRSVTVLER